MLPSLPLNTKLTIEENIHTIHKFDVIEFDVEISANYLSQSIYSSREKNLIEFS